VAALIYVDDVIIMGNDTNKIKEKFSVKDFGTLKYFFGIEVTHTRKGMVLNQKGIFLHILEESGMMGCRPSVFPIEQNTKLGKNDEEVRVYASKY